MMGDRCKDCDRVLWRETGPRLCYDCRRDRELYGDEVMDAGTSKEVRDES